MDTLTLDEAAEINLVDERQGNLVPVDQAPQEDHLPYDPEGPLHDDSRSSLTLDQAAQIGWNDDGERASQLKPASVAAKIDGREVTLWELVQSYSTREQMQGHAARLTNEYYAVQEAAQGVVNAAWELSRWVVAQMPPEPDAALARVNPDEYTRQQAIHDTSLGNVSHILQQAQLARASAHEIEARYHNINLQAENARLVQHFPEAGDMSRRDQFFERIFDVAAACDFTRDEFEKVVDHRLIRLGALALKGMEALAEAPQPKEKRRQRRKRYSDAMERLIHTGSFEAAMRVDFD